MFARVKALSICLILLIAAMSLGCSEGSSGPAVGTPEWYWPAATENFARQDFVKTEEHLDSLIKSESEWQKRGVAWRLVVLSGLTRGYMNLSDAYVDGLKENEAQARQFQNPIQQYRRDARQYAIALAESVGPFLKMVAADDSVTLDFAFPAGTPNQSPLIASVSGGTFPQEGPRAEAEDAALMRGILLQTTLLAAGGDDVNKARTLFEAGSAEAPRLVFLAGLAKTLYSTAELFDRLHLNQPDIGRILVDRSKQCLDLALAAEDEETKKIAEAIQQEIDEDSKEREKMERRYKQAGM